jgi:hypothetical protein
VELKLIIISSSGISITDYSSFSISISMEENEELGLSYWGAVRCSLLGLLHRCTGAGDSYSKGVRAHYAA